MASFYIGQRVRVLHADYCPHALGAQATVMTGLYPEKGAFGYGILVDGCPSGIPSGEWFSEPHCLAPISDSNQLSSWEAMKELNLWIPDEMRAGA